MSKKSTIGVYSLYCSSVCVVIFFVCPSFFFWQKETKKFPQVRFKTWAKVDHLQFHYFSHSVLPHHLQHLPLSLYWICRVMDCKECCPVDLSFETMICPYNTKTLRSPWYLKVDDTVNTEKIVKTSKFFSPKMPFLRRQKPKCIEKKATCM